MPDQPTSRRSSTPLAVVCALLILALPAQASDFSGFGEFMLVMGVGCMQLGFLVAILIAYGLGGFRKKTGFIVGMVVSGAVMVLAIFGALAVAITLGPSPYIVFILLTGAVNMLLPSVQYGLAKRKREHYTVEDYTPAERDDAESPVEPPKS